jgi:hypothetical protein
MRATDFVTEADFDPGIRDELQRQGYRFLGSGVDQQAYLAPDGTVMKIFGTQHSRKGSTKLTRAQKAFKLFADYCRANSSNPFLPEFSDWNMFHYDDRPYLQIKSERLFEFPGNLKVWARILEDIAVYARWGNTNARKQDWLQQKLINPDTWIDIYRVDSVSSLLVHLGENGFNQLWGTIHQLAQLAEQNGIMLDLHDGNFMLGSDGHIVISDPFFTGYGSR